MATLTSTLIARLIDNVSGPANKATSALQRLVGASRVQSNMRAGSIAALSRDLSLLRQNADRIGHSVSGPLALLGALGFKTAFEFERAGNFLEALGDATKEQRAEFERFANSLNEKYPQSVTEILKTGTELLKAGLNFQQMLGALDPTLATAILGDMKPSEVANMISAAINAFQLPKETTEQALRSTTTIADRMTYAAVNTTASLRDMGEMFKYVAGAAATTGNTIDDVTAMAMAFSQNAVNGSQAGVALRSAIVRLAKGGTREGRAALARVGMEIPRYQRGRQPVTTDRIMSSLLAGGINPDGSMTGPINVEGIRAQIDAVVKDPTLINSVTRMAAKITALVQAHMQNTGSAIDARVIADSVQESIIAAGSKIDLVRFFTDLREKMAKGLLTEGDLNNILEGRHFARYAALMQADLNKIKAEIEANAAGYAQSRYQTTLQGIVGPTYELTAAIEKLAIALGRSVFSDVAAVFRSLAQSITDLSKSNPELLRVATYAGLVAIAMIPLGLALAGIKGVIGVAVGAFGLLASAAALAGWPILLIGAALLGVGYAVYVFRDKISGAMQTIRDKVYDVAQSTSEKLREWADSFRGRASNALDRLAEGMESGSGALFGWIRKLGSELIETIKVGLSPLYGLGADLIGSLWDGMKARAGGMLSWLQGIGARIRGSLSLPWSRPQSEQGTTPGQGATGASPAARAAGGPVTRGMPYLVGERRPEIFTPSTDGYIHPRVGKGGAAASITIPVTMHVSGVHDPRAAAEEATSILTRRVSAELRTVFADVGIKV